MSAIPFARTARAVIALILVMGGLGAAALSIAGSANAANFPGDTLSVTAPATATVGTAVMVTVDANTALAAPDVTFADKVHFALTPTDAATTLPADYTFVPASDQGEHVFMVTFKTAGSYKITVTDTATTNPATAGMSGTVVVTGGGGTTTPTVTKFSVTAPATASTGSSVSVTVTAQDASNATVTGYTGTVHLTSNDTTATITPVDYMFTAADMGTHTFTVVFNTAGSFTVTATQTSPTATPQPTGTSTPATVVTAAGPATKLKVVAPTMAQTGTAVSFTVTAQDAPGNTATGYTGTVHLTSSDTAATITPTDYQFTAADKGQHTFMITFKTVGSQTITATDTTTSTITGQSNAVSVTGAAVATKFLVAAPATASTGTPVVVKVTAQDANSATLTGYVGTVHLTSSDPMATITPADYTFTAADAGAHNFSVTFKTAGSQTVTATQTMPTATPQPTGTSNMVTVSSTTLQTTTQVGSNPAALRALVTATPTTAGTTAPTPTGTVAFTVNGAAAGTATLDANGTATLAYTLKTGTQTVVATYSGASGFAGSNGMRTVTPPKVTPTLTSANPKSSYGWYRNNVKVSYTCTAGSAAVLSCPKVTTLSQEGKAVSVTKTIVDKDGGRTVVTTTAMIDKTKPTVSVTGVMNGHTYQSQPHLTCKASDSLSGVASCTITKTHQGKHYTYVATATDKAGNKATVRGGYDLKANK